MKVNSIWRQNLNNTDFKGISPVKSDKGFKLYEFNYPFDENHFNCYVELYPVTVDENGNFIVYETPYENVKSGEKFIQITPEKNKINLAKDFRIGDNEKFAYHYKLLPKSVSAENYDAAEFVTEAGTVVVQGSAKHQKFNIYTPSSGCNNGGAMKLLLPDTYNAGFTYDQDGKITPNKDKEKLYKSVRTFANKAGGNLAGIEKDVTDGKFDGYTRIVSTPLFTDDSISSHAYWNKNCMQMAQSLGNTDNYRSLQKALFAHGLNLVSDGAFVNEGLEGIHFKHVLRWGNKSPFFNWFRISGLKDSPLTMPVFAKNKEFIKHRVVNPKYEYTQNADGSVICSGKLSAYDSSKPTFIQIYDKRCVNEDNLDSQKLIKSYDIMNTDNPFEINNHNDTVIPYAFEIDPDTYDLNIKNLIQYNRSVPEDKKIFIDTLQGTRFLTKFNNFNLEEKYECGFETWDANADIAKLNYVPSNTDTKELANISDENTEQYLKNMRYKNFEVQDYAVKSGEFWTKKTAQILNLYIAQNLKNIEKDNPGKVYKMILDNIEAGIFPKKLKSAIDEQVVTNILNRRYYLKNNSIQDTFENIVLANLMEMPLDSVELGDDITAVFASPYISKYATSEKYIGKSRYELYKNGNPQLPLAYSELYEKMNKLYEREMSDFAIQIIRKLDALMDNNSKIISEPNATEYGKFILPAIVSEIARYSVIKGLFPSADFKSNDNGEISYDYNRLKETSMNELGIIASSPEDEAEYLITKLRKGIRSLSKNKNAQKELVDALRKSLKGTDANSFALAEAIVDRTQSGLDWRIDAVKDIGDMDAIRNGNTDFEYTWNQVIKFWNKFTEGVLRQNPNSYLAAEITNESELFNQGEGYFGKRFKNIESGNYFESDIIAKFLRETGMTTTANYRYLFSPLPDIFAQNFETGSTADNHGHYLDKLLFEKFIGKDNYFQSGPLQSLLYAYTFVGNHDKPRALHCMALDMKMFFSLKGYEEQAYRMIRNNFFEDIPQDDFQKFKEHEFTEISSKNIAMAYALRDGFVTVLNRMKDEKRFVSENDYTNTFKEINDAISDLANGKFEGKDFEADAFGFRPFDVTIDAVLRQAKFHGLNLNEKDRKILFDKVFRQILEPANQKLLAMMKILVALPGNPTLYAGDDLNSTGFEYKTKNVTTDNRSYLHHEWTDEYDTTNYMKFAADYEEKYREVMNTRARKELRALNNGTPYTLALQNGYFENRDRHPVTALMYQSTDGAMVISLFNTTGIERNHKANYMPQKLYLPSIDLYRSSDNEKIGLPKGLRAAEQGDDGKFYGNGLIFKNADKSDGSIYKVCREKDKGLYFIKRFVKEDNGNVKEADIELDDTTMNLYYDPKNQVSFTGRQHSKVLYNPQYYFGNPYKNISKQSACGEKLALIK